MNAKLQVLIFTLVLLAGMVSVSESFFGGKNGGVGKKRSNLEKVMAQLGNELYSIQ